MSDSSLSMPMTRHPPAPSRAAVAAPIPEAAPVMTTVRSGSGSRLEEGERLVGVGAHGDLAVQDVEHGAIGVDDERGGACDIAQAVVERVVANGGVTVTATGRDRGARSDRAV